MPRQKTTCDQSSSVRIVREFLEQEFKKISTFIDFDFLGPSPFHAYFDLEGSNELLDCQHQSFQMERTTTPAYDNIHFKYNTSDFGDEVDAIQELFEALEEEFAFFYNFKLKESSRIQRWSDISNDLHEILSIEDGTKKISFLAKLHTKPKLIRRIIRKLGIFKGQEIFDESQRKEDYSDVYQDGNKNTFLKTYTDKSIRNSSKYPIKETEELIVFFDKKDSKSLELVIVFIAAVMGGIVGSLITVLAK